MFRKFLSTLFFWQMQKCISNVNIMSQKENLKKKKKKDNVKDIEKGADIPASGLYIFPTNPLCSF